MRTWLAILFTLSLVLPGLATTFYLDPVNGNLNNPGTMAAPWPSLMEVIQAGMVETQEYAPLPYDPATSKLVVKNAGSPVQAGDTLMLMSDQHGEVEIDRHVNTGMITILAAPDHQPILATLHLRSSAYWRIEGLTISTEPYGYYTNDHLLFIESHGWRGPADHIEIRNCTVTSGADSWNWTLDQWLTRSTNGINVVGDHILIEDNLVTNIDMGISIVGDSCIARNNQIINFSGDGIRPLGSHLLIEGNLIKNCFDIDDNHDDGIQSFNLGTYNVTDVIIRGNTILNYDDPNQPFLGPLQGIGCFDGPFTNWVIENNVISVNHWHGISLYGAVNCRIINNTVLDPTPGTTPGPSWILVTDKKDGTPSTGCIAKNNLTNTLNVDGEQSHNLTLAGIPAYDLYFVDHSLADFHLLAGCPAIDQADPSVAPPLDRDGVTRPQGNGVDIGAYEYLAPSALQPTAEAVVRLAPNPCTDRCIIQLDRPFSAEQPTLSLTNLYGQSVPCPYTRSDSQTLIIDTRNLAAGWYWVQLDQWIIPLIKVD